MRLAVVFCVEFMIQISILVEYAPIYAVGWCFPESHVRATSETTEE